MSKIKNLIFISLLFFSANILAQQNNSEKHITNVFNKLVSAYGHAKSAPKLKIINASAKLNTPARYFSSPSPTVKVDAHLYTICSNFSKNRDNALAIVLGHELAHYYNDHTFCTDFAFAIRKDQINLSSKLKALSKTEKLALETEADHKGLFYSCMAGYKPFNVYPKLLDAIYNEYNLPEKTSGYPSKSERKSVNLQAQEKVKKLYTLFLEGITSGKKGNYNGAIESFKELNSYFPSRENYNNLGVFKTLKAMEYRTISRAESKNPNRFKYPLSIDHNSLLKQPSAYRSLNENDFAIMESLLKSAQKDFEKAISLDEKYTQSYINLACVFDLLDNPMAAIGKIKELPLPKQKNNSAQRILAIAFYHAELETKANNIWTELNL